MSKLLPKLLLVLLIASTVLTACGTTTTPTPAATTAAPTEAPATAEPTQATPEPTTPPPPEEPVVIELWASPSVSEAGAPPEDWVAYSIIREKLNIELKLVLLPSAMADQDTKINAAAAANQLPDLFQVNRDVWYKLVDAGLVAPVDDLITMMPERAKTHYNDAERNKLVTIDGVMYGLPEPGNLPKTDGLVIRKDWLDKLGLQPPTNLDELLTVAKAFTEQDPDGNGQNDTYGFGGFIDGAGLLNAGLGTRFDFIFAAYGVGGMWNLDPNNFGLNARNPNYMKAVEYVKSMVDAGVIDPDWPTLKKDEFRARWKQGRYGIMIENFCALICKANYKDFDTNFPDGEWVLLPPPTGPDGKSGEGVYVKGVRIWGVSQRAVDDGKAEAIARLLEWMSSDEGYYLLGFGQEGVNYKRDANGFVTTEGIAPEMAYSAKEQQPLTQIRTLVFINNEVELRTRYVIYQSANGREMNPLELLAGFTAQPWVESTGAAVISPPANSADFARFYSENIVKFVLGQQPLNEQTWEEFIAGLDSLGAKDLEAAALQELKTSGFIK